MRRKRKLRSLTPLILAMILCCAVFSGVTYSLFTVSVSNTGNQIKTAAYTLSIHAANITGEEDADTANSIPVDGSYTFAENGTVQFTLTVSGTASSVYCDVYVDQSGAEQEHYRTEAISLASGSETLYVFEIAADEGTVITFEPNWKKYTSSEVSIIENNESIDLTTETFQDPTESTEATTEPEEDPTEATTEPTEPAEDSTETTTAPTEPVEDSTETTTAPTEPVEDPTETTTAPTEAVEDPTETTTAPTEPVEDSTETTVAPTEPVEDSTETTTAPTEPGDDSTESTEATVKSDETK